MMRRLTTLLTILTFTGLMLAACGGDSGTGPDPGNEDNGEEETTTYTVEASAAEGGSVSPSGSSDYEEGETAELTAEANDEHVFSGWTGDMGSSDNPLSLTVDQDYSLTANFEKKNYALTTNTDGDGVIAEEIVQEKATDYEHGTVVELTASPGGDWKFVEWTGDLSDTDNPAQITVDNPKEVTAVFEKRSYPLTIFTDGPGAVSEQVIQQKTTDYEHGTTVELAPTAPTGWEFDEWQGDLSGNETPVQVTVTQPTTIVADFDLLDESSRPDFYLAENGVTIKCEDAADGATGTVDGATYAKRSAGDIDAANAPSTCTSGITDMSSMFNGDGSFNGDISHWDVSSVTDMTDMFFTASSFNQDISHWDVSDVDNMSQMFRNATSFDQNIGGWDVSSVTDMNFMFRRAESFNQDIGDWDVSGVTDMSGMFNRAGSFNGDISSWDVSAVTDMEAMFRNASSFNQDIGDWDVSDVENMGFMFNDATSFDQDLSGWCVSQIDFNSTDFDAGAGFEGDDGLQPQWGESEPCSDS